MTPGRATTQEGTQGPQAGLQLPEGPKHRARRCRREYLNLSQKMTHMPHVPWLCPELLWALPLQTPHAPCPGHSLGEGIEPVGLLGVGEGDAHAGGERGVQHDGRALVARGQVNRGHGADALSVQNDVLRADPVPAWDRAAQWAGRYSSGVTLLWSLHPQGSRQGLGSVCPPDPPQLLMAGPRGSP